MFINYKSLNNISICRFLVFTLGSLFLFYNSYGQILLPDDQWNPISFYQLLNGPISATVYNSFNYFWLMTSLIAGLGFRFRLFSVLAFLSGLFILGYEYNFGHVYHSKHLYIGSVGFFALWGESEYSLKLIRYYAVYILFVAGLEKLYFGEGLTWALSSNLYLQILESPVQTKFGRWILSQNLAMSQAIAFVSLVFIELMSPLSLWVFKKYKSAVLFVASWTLFHVMVTLTFGGHTQFFSHLFCYSVFINWREILSVFSVYPVLENGYSNLELNKNNK